MMKRFLSVGVLLLCSVSLTAQAGDSAKRSEKRDLQAFQRVETKGSIKLEVMTGIKKQSVTIESKNADVGLITTIVKDGLLVIDAKDLERIVKGSVDAKVTIEMRTLESLTSSGAVTGKVDALKGDSFVFDSSGASDMQFKGKVKSFSVKTAGAGSVAAAELVAEIVTAEVAGAGDIEVHATKELIATVAGAGVITYHGSPSKVVPKIAGFGKIEPFAKK